MKSVLPPEFPLLEVGVAVGGVALVALATAIVVMLCRNKQTTQNSQEDEENTEVWGPPATKRTSEKREFSTYDDMYADAQEAKPRAPATAEEEVKYEMGYEEGEYLEQ